MQAVSPANAPTSTRASDAWWLWPGLALAAAAWWASWFGPDLLRHHAFFPLWFGYILVVDALVRLRAGESLLTRNPARWVLLFAFSVPLWWVFEWANRFLGNWRYVLPYPYDPVTYALLASLAFSTVMPALFETASLLRTFKPFSGPMRGPRIAPGRAGLVAIAALGALMFGASLRWPGVAFPLVWIGLFLCIDPLNRLLGWRSLAGEVAGRRWDTVVVLWAAGLLCGFFWELWNVLAMPKWVYYVPFVGEPKLFEMPLLGYGGYLPFALEVFAAYHLLHGLLFRRADGYLPFAADGSGDGDCNSDGDRR
jgi:hypothetical protein